MLTSSNLNITLCNQQLNLVPKQYIYCDNVAGLVHLEHGDNLAGVDRKVCTGVDGN